jgi:hypothetical protein
VARERLDAQPSLQSKDSWCTLVLRMPTNVPGLRTTRVPRSSFRSISSKPSELTPQDRLEALPGPMLKFPLNTVFSLEYGIFLRIRYFASNTVFSNFGAQDVQTASLEPFLKSGLRIPDSFPGSPWALGGPGIGKGLPGTGDPARAPVYERGHNTGRRLRCTAHPRQGLGGFQERHPVPHGRRRIPPLSALQPLGRVGHADLRSPQRLLRKNDPRPQTLLPHPSKLPPSPQLLLVGDTWVVGPPDWPACCTDPSLSPRDCCLLGTPT